MDTENVFERLYSLQRDLTAFCEVKIINLERLSAELEASIEDLRKLCAKKGKNEESRRHVNPATTPKPATLKIEDAEYKVTENFRAAALQVSDELDLDELEAAKLCIQAGAATEGVPDSTLAYQALLLFHQQRNVLLDCVRLLLLQTVDLDAGDETGEAFRELARRVIRGQDGNPDAASAYWRKCMDGLADIEGLIQKVGDHHETAIMTGISNIGDGAEALVAQRILLARGHESLASIMSYLVRGGHTAREDFRSLLSKAAAQQGQIDVSFHYLPVLVSGSAYFGADESTTFEAAKDIHSLFAAGPGQLQWKQPAFKAAATVCWLAEYSSRFLDPTSAQTLRVADRQREEEDRTKLFMDSVKEKGFHFLLNACQFLKPELWHDPAKIGFVRYLLEDTPPVQPSIPESTAIFSSLTMNEFQAFSDAFVANMPDVLRRLKADEDEQRRALFSGPIETGPSVELDLERFLVIMAFAYQDDPDAAQDFWSDKENNLYGFLRWASQRLPTPRVAAFCELLRAIASDEKSGNQAHLFLKEDTVMTGNKLRKSYSVSWAQIFSELEIFASTVKNKPAAATQATNGDSSAQDGSYIEPETYIMLEFYMRLAAHVCRISPDARNWILREQTFHLGETLFHLASTGNDSRIHANCFDMLAALLTDKVPEVNDGMWVLLDNWISGGGYGGSNVPRPGRQAHPERQYLLNYVSNPETARGLVDLLCALITPTHSQTELILDALPFPESLGTSSRQAGIDVYVDWILGTVFRSTSSHPALTGEIDQNALDVLRCSCLNFAVVCLSTFNEDLVALANATNLGVESAMRTSSLAAYARLHPFARVMDWLFNNNVINALAHVVHQDIDALNALEPSSPRVQATLRSVQLMNLGMKLQATYFDIVRPLISVAQQSSRSPAVANTSLSSFDEVVLSQLDVVVEVTSFAASTNADLSLEAMSLLQKLCASRKLGDAPQYENGGRTRVGSRLVGKLSERSDAITREILPYFDIYEWDVEAGEQPFKVLKAKAVLDVLNNSLDTSGGRPAIAHCLLGFQCHLRTVDVRPGSSFSLSDSLFHSIARCAAEAPVAIGQDNTSWLMALKRGCLDVVLKLALSPLTSAIVLPELRAMDFLAAASRNQILANTNSLWDEKPLSEPSLLLDSSALAVRDFLHVRDDFFEYAALELRTVTDIRAFSVQEKVVSTLLGTIKFPNGEQESTDSVFDLFDMLEMVTSTPSDASCKYFKDIDLSMCLKDDSDTVTAFDVGMAEQNLILRKRELFSTGVIKETQEELQVDDEIRAILASLTSMNNWRAIQDARMSTLESWTDLMSLLAAQKDIPGGDLAVIALQGLQVVLPRLEKTLGDNLDAAALLAKLTLTLVPAAAGEGSSQRAGLAHERLLAAFRVSLKGITDSGAALALRDVCYRICCAVLASVPLTVENGKTSPSPNAKQLLQLIQSSGDRLITVITEDAFSGRGMTRVSSLLFLDALVALFQISSITTAILRALTKLNFIPVLIDSSIGSIASSFQGENGELLTAVAYFHTAMSLLLRICQTADGTQLVLNSGFFAATADSRLFSTDPDIGLDIDNPVALREFYKLLSAVLRVVTAAVIARGPGNATVLQQAKTFLQQNRFSMQAVFKRTSEVKKTAGPPETEALEVADEFSKLLLVTGFLEVSYFIRTV